MVAKSRHRETLANRCFSAFHRSNIPPECKRICFARRVSRALSDKAEPILLPGIDIISRTAAARLYIRGPRIHNATGFLMSMLMGAIYRGVRAGPLPTILGVVVIS